ncbi:nucleotide-diphospho-sugar transferase [Phycomyces blakesleeanus]|uniref:Translation initiation factor eIF2B subunit epsilon n=1 Tax=Phycomyces blakesleeanus TaxID=4837 RepID=A0ABR3ANS6_PHYBL
MPPKNKRATQAQNNDGDEQPFQAVILTDSYDERFLPISHEMPRCLMPLCNIPLIEYTLEVLAIADVVEVFIVCTSHIETIKAYFENSSWMSPQCKLNVQIVQTPDAMSVGDALRELDARQLITSDFILTIGDLVSNIKLDKALEAHRARKKTDKNSIMTMVLKETTRTHPSRPKDNTGVFVLDPKTERCLFYEPVTALPRKGRFEMSPEIFENRTQVEFRNDLVDPRLDICSVEVPALLSENFDWQRHRRDFLHGILTSDILGKTVYTHIVSEPYVARIENEQLYATVSKHILNRWAFPVVPETNLKQGDDYEFSRGNIYKSGNVSLSRSCMIDEDVQIGSGSVIGQSTRIAHSVIGRNCNIGDNVVLEGAFLWDGCVIEKNCKVTKSILANNVTLLEGTTIEKGSLVSVGVSLGPKEDIPKYSKLSLEPQPKNSIFADDSDEEEEEEDDHQRVLTGKHAPVYFWVDRVGDDDEEDVRNTKLGGLAFDMADLVLEDHELSDSASEIGDFSDVESDSGSIGGAWNLDSSVTTAKQSADFKNEIAQTIGRALEENHSVDTAALEITGLRMSSNGTYTEVREVLIPALIDHIDIANPVSSMKLVFNKWGPLITKVTHSLDDQAHVLLTLQNYCASRDAFTKLFAGALQLLYHADVVDEDAVMKWYTSEAAKSGTPAERKLREKSTAFIEWLNDAEEESDEDSDDE